MDISPGKFSISFIVPVLNGEKYIADCLNHIIDEMATGDEIIIVDNGSTDNTLSIISSYHGVKILNCPKSTIAAVRNEGAATARNNLLAFIDCDCLICKGWRLAAITVLSANNVVATGSHLDLPERPSWIEAAWTLAGNSSATPARYIPSGNFIVKSAAFKAVSGFDETMITDEDTDIGMRLCQKGFGIINAPRVRAIHLANPKTIKQFTSKERWHATSILKKASWSNIDKPMIMTYAFMTCLVIALAALPLVVLGKVSFVLVLAIIIAVPLATAVYRLLQYGRFRYFFPQILLYLLFYAVRSYIIVRLFFLDRE